MEEPGSQAEPRLVADRYRLGAMSGRGGMGMVWQATDELIGRPVAVKELRPPAGLSAGERAVITQRALREARTAGQVRHPGVIAIHDIVPATADDDAIYIVMELITAPTLADILNRAGVLPEGRVRKLGVRILAALAAAHEIGVVHRDVKPGNIMVLSGDEVKLIDFGIAHTHGRDPPDPRRDHGVHGLHGAGVVPRQGPFACLGSLVGRRHPLPRDHRPRAFRP
jgi:serine/threonine protein kinase